MSSTAHTLALHAIEDHTTSICNARCKRAKAMRDALTEVEKGKVVRTWEKPIRQSTQYRERARAEAMSLYSQALDRISELEGEIERLRKGRVA